MPKPFYITTTLPYVNAEPHIGFALEIIQADAIARFQEISGREIFFSTGTDEHGQKIWQKSEEEGKDAQAYVDEFAAKFKKLKEDLNLHKDLHFIRTTDPAHVRAAQEMWKLCEKDIYKKAYRGLYCVGDEAFVRESDLVDGRCPNHPNLELQIVEEENYFFNFGNYKSRLRDYLVNDSIIPEWRRNEALSALEAMEDISISREKSRLSWGVPVPGDETQVMYVWFDALTNYISTLGWPGDAEGLYKKFWVDGETLQLAGKDQVKFQSIIWQAMLMSAELPNTDLVFYHGFITSGGQKMSKSLGNVIHPDDLIKKFGVDALRYYLLRHVSTFEDGDVTLESFKDAYNGNLANGLGNLTSRIMKMAETHLSEPVVVEYHFHETLKDLLVRFELGKAMDHIWHEIGEIDRTIQEKEPFKLVKTDPEKGREIIRDLVAKLAHIGYSLASFMPETSEKILTAIKQNHLESGLFPRKE
jgi:methionyl-tRNA synthetase